MSRIQHIFVSLLLMLAVHSLRAQGTDTLLGKWKFSGLSQKKTEGALPYEKFVAGQPAPQFQYVEFKTGNDCVYNEENMDDAGSEYSLTGHRLTLGGITYNVKFNGTEQLTLSREMYSYKDAEGKTIYIRKEELSFKRLF